MTCFADLAACIADAMNCLTLPFSESCTTPATGLVKRFADLMTRITNAMKCLTLPFP